MERREEHADIAELLESGKLTAKYTDEILRLAHDDPFDVEIRIDRQPVDEDIEQKQRE